MSHLKTIGILGGMGPEATILLQQRILAAIDARDDCDHIPLLIDMNPQVPSRIDFLLKGTGEDPGNTLIEMARRLEGAGAQALAMPCNTAHFFAPQIQAAVNIPLLNMVSYAVDAIFKRVGVGGKVGVLASPATKETGLFETAFASKQVEVVFPTDQAKMLESIQRIKSDGVNEFSCEVLASAGKDCERQGANALLVGCSEFSMIANSATGHTHKELACIDTLDLLVDEIQHFSQKQ